ARWRDRLPAPGCKRGRRERSGRRTSQEAPWPDTHECPCLGLPWDYSFTFPACLFACGAGRFACLDGGRRGEEVFRHFLRRSIDHLAVERSSAFALSFGFLESNENALGALDFLRRRRIDLVGKIDLRRMDRPLAFHAESSTAAR